MCMPVRYMYSDEADAAARIIQRWWTEIKVLSGVSLEVIYSVDNSSFNYKLRNCTENDFSEFDVRDRAYDDPSFDLHNHPQDIKSRIINNISVSPASSTVGDLMLKKLEDFAEHINSQSPPVQTINFFSNNLPSSSVSSQRMLTSNNETSFYSETDIVLHDDGDNVSSSTILTRERRNWTSSLHNCPKLNVSDLDYQKSNIINENFNENMQIKTTLLSIQQLLIDLKNEQKSNFNYSVESKEPIINRVQVEQLSCKMDLLCSKVPFKNSMCVKQKSKAIPKTSEPIFLNKNLQKSSKKFTFHENINGATRPRKKDIFDIKLKEHEDERERLLKEILRLKQLKVYKVAESSKTFMPKTTISNISSGLTASSLISPKKINPASNKNYIKSVVNNSNPTDSGCTSITLKKVKKQSKNSPIESTQTCNIYKTPNNRSLSLKSPFSKENSPPNRDGVRKSSKEYTTEDFNIMDSSCEKSMRLLENLHHQNSNHGHILTNLDIRVCKMKDENTELNKPYHLCFNPKDVLINDSTPPPTTSILKEQFVSSSLECTSTSLLRPILINSCSHDHVSELKNDENAKDNFAINFDSEKNDSNETTHQQQLIIPLRFLSSNSSVDETCPLGKNSLDTLIQTPTHPLSPKTSSSTRKVTITRVRKSDDLNDLLVLNQDLNSMSINQDNNEVTSITVADSDSFELKFDKRNKNISGASFYVTPFVRDEESEDFKALKNAEETLAAAKKDFYLPRSYQMCQSDTNKSIFVDPDTIKESNIHPTIPHDINCNGPKWPESAPPSPSNALHQSGLIVNLSQSALKSYERPYPTRVTCLRDSFSRPPSIKSTSIFGDDEDEESNTSDPDLKDLVTSDHEGDALNSDHCENLLVSSFVADPPIALLKLPKVFASTSRHFISLSNLPNSPTIIKKSLQRNGSGVLSVKEHQMMDSINIEYDGGHDVSRTDLVTDNICELPQPPLDIYSQRLIDSQFKNIDISSNINLCNVIPEHQLNLDNERVVEMEDKGHCSTIKLKFTIPSIRSESPVSSQAVLEYLNKLKIGSNEPEDIDQTVNVCKYDTSHSSIKNSNCNLSLNSSNLIPYNFHILSPLNERIISNFENFDKNTAENVQTCSNDAAIPLMMHSDTIPLLQTEKSNWNCTQTNIFDPKNIDRTNNFKKSEKSLSYSDFLTSCSTKIVDPLFDVKKINALTLEKVDSKAISQPSPCLGHPSRQEMTIQSQSLYSKGTINEQTRLNYFNQQPVDSTFIQIPSTSPTRFFPPKSCSIPLQPQILPFEQKFANNQIELNKNPTFLNNLQVLEINHKNYEMNNESLNLSVNELCTNFYNSSGQVNQQFSFINNQLNDSNSNFTTFNSTTPKSTSEEFVHASNQFAIQKGNSPKLSNLISTTDFPQIHGKQQDMISTSPQLPKINKCPLFNSVSTRQSMDHQNTFSYLISQHTQEDLHNYTQWN